MPAGWAAAGAAAATAVGGYMQSKSASDAAEAQANALREQGAIQYERAQEAAGRVPEFKPVTVTSSFGTPQYTYDSSGRLTGVSSQAAPWLANLQTQGQGMAGQYLNLQEQALANQAGFNASNQAFQAGQGLYGLAQQAMPTSYDTTQATQDYYNQMQGLVAAGRERDLAATRQGLFNRGRQGLAIGATQAGGELATNPEMAAYYNAIAKQDAALALDARSRALADLQAQQAMGLGLFSAGGAQTTLGGNALNQYYTNIAAAQAPYTTGMSQLSSLEAMQNQPVTQGMGYGTTVTSQANQIADAYMRASGAGAAANTAAIQAQYQADASNPWAAMLIGGGQALGRSAGAFGGGGASSTDAAWKSSGFTRGSDGLWGMSIEDARAQGWI
jgi:YD repeat-containing protein